MIAVVWGLARPYVLNPVMIGVIAVFLAFQAGYWKGKWQAEISITAALEIADLKAKIANLENEKQIAIAAQKQVEADEAELKQLASDQERKINELVDTIAHSGKACPIDSSTMCRRYRVCAKDDKDRKRKASNRP